eukprot:14540276-Alexandrium_andersonii.AAC.1
MPGALAPNGSRGSLGATQPAPMSPSRRYSSRLGRSAMLLFVGARSTQTPCSPAAAASQKAWTQ